VFLPQLSRLLILPAKIVPDPKSLYGFYLRFRPFRHLFSSDFGHAAVPPPKSTDHKDARVVTSVDRINAYLIADAKNSLHLRLSLTDCVQSSSS
jgi:hypothetical protein